VTRKNTDILPNQAPSLVPPAGPARQAWEPMQLIYVGHVGTVLQATGTKSQPAVDGITVLKATGG